MDRSPSWIKVLPFSILICCVTVHSYGVKKNFTPLGSNRFLLSVLPEDDDREKHSPPFDYAVQIKREKDGKMIICGRTTCLPGTEVKPCETNYTDDSCIDCPPGTQMFDITHSEAHVLHCVKIPSCHEWPGTIETAEMQSCAGGFKMKCRCHTEDGKCGLDPCHCRKRSCPVGETLQQDCDCKVVVHSRPRITPKAEGTTRRTKKPTMPLSQLTLDNKQQPIETNPTEITQQPVKEDLPPTRPQEGVVLPSPCSPEEANSNERYWPDANDWKTISSTIVIIILMFGCMGFVCFRKKSTKLFRDATLNIKSRFQTFSGRLPNCRRQGDDGVEGISFRYTNRVH